MTRSNPYLISLSLEGQRVLVIGGGAAAEAKVETLLGTGAELIVIARRCSERVRQLAGAGELIWRKRSFRPWDVLGARLVISATDDRGTDERVRRWAKRARVMINVVDTPDLCDVTIPAMIRRGPATIGISTGGTSPAAARFVREQLFDAIPSGLGELLEHAAAARHDLRSSGHYRYDYRSWHDDFFIPGLDLIRSEGVEQLPTLRSQFVRDFNRS